MRFIQFLEICVARFRKQGCVQRGMNAADHGGQMRYEGQADFTGVSGDGFQSLDDFRKMAVALDTIGMEVVGRFRKK